MLKRKNGYFFRDTPTTKPSLSPPTSRLHSPSSLFHSSESSASTFSAKSLSHRCTVSSVPCIPLCPPVSLCVPLWTCWSQSEYSK